MKQLMIIPTLLIAFVIHAWAQKDMDQGMNFERELNWQQILTKAKAGNKYIFVDCYATWCGPCKMMDRDVYSNDSVAQEMNARLISVKVQMDTTEMDSEGVKAWYPDAHMLSVSCKIGGFPSFLFFSPDGHIVHRGIGFQKPSAFLALVGDALDIHKQYYTLLDQYQTGTRDFEAMRYLLKNAREYIGTDIARAMEADYLHGYLDKLSMEELCTRENLEFMGQVVEKLSSQDRVFECYYRHGALVDSVMQDKNLSREYVNYIVQKEEIAHAMTVAKKSQREPDWKSIERKISRKFGPTYVEENVTDARVGWYRHIKDWKNYTRYLVKQIDLQGVENVPDGLGGILMLNNSAWEIFLHSDDKTELEKAITWTDRAIEMESPPEAGAMDTKANLLYKLGKKEEAIALESKAVELAPNAKDIVVALHKMQQGEPTWVTP